MIFTYWDTKGILLQVMYSSVFFSSTESIVSWYLLMEKQEKLQNYKHLTIL